MVLGRKKSEILRGQKGSLMASRKNIDELLCNEEIYWAQCSTTNWLEDGNKNTKYFHQKASQRNKVNKIKKIRDDEGIYHDNEKDIASILSNYFLYTFFLHQIQQVWIL